MKENIQQTALTKHFRALGTSISLTVFGTLDQTVLEKSADLVNHYEDVLTVNRDHSQLMSVNQAAGKFPVQVEASVYQLTKLAVEKSRANFGFNAAIGPLVKLWHIGFSDAKVPSEQQISERLSLIDPWQIELNDADQSIFLKKAGMEIDLGAIAKGYIADRLKDFLVKKGVNSAIINLGGNVLCIGSKPDGTPFKVGIQKPFADRNETEAVMDITGKSVVSSGIYERCFKQNGKLYHHILNPKTGYPYDNSLISVTIISDQSVDGDALSTTCFALGLEDGLKFAEKKGVQAVLITEDYELHYTDGFQDEINVTDVES